MAAYRRGKGRIFYFSPGDQDYLSTTTLMFGVFANAVAWAAQGVMTCGPVLAWLVTRGGQDARPRTPDHRPPIERPHMPSAAPPSFRARSRS